MADDFDIVPIRLPSGTKVVMRVPRVFTLEDGIHLMNILSMYLTDKTGEVLPLGDATASAATHQPAAHASDKGGDSK